MAQRKGERVGWIGGWLGGFVWVLILAVVFLVQGRSLEAIIGMAILAIGVALILLVSPWRHPTTPYWKLLLPIFGAFFAAIVWGVCSMGELGGMGLSWWSLFLLLPLLSPFVTIGAKRWTDGESKPDANR